MLILILQENNSQQNLPKLYNIRNNQDGNQVMEADIINAAGALADHQENFDGKFRDVENTSVSYLSEDSSSLDNTMGESSYKFFTNSQNSLASANSSGQTPSCIQENSERISEKKKGIQYIQEYEHNSQGVLHQFTKNNEIGEEFSDLHSANDNGSNGEGESHKSRTIRSVTLTQTGTK